MSVVVTSSKIARQENVLRMMAAKFNVSKNEDGTDTAKVENQAIEGKGNTEQAALYDVQKQLKDKIAKEGMNAFKNKDLKG